MKYFWDGAEMKRVAPRDRTIFYSEVTSCKNVACRCRRFSFPELVFFYAQHNLIVTIEYDFKFYPFRFFNIYDDGRVCLPRFAIDLKDAVDLFWESRFNSELNDDTSLIAIDDSEFYLSFWDWEHKTLDEPEFMKTKFSPKSFADDSSSGYYRFRHCPIDGLGTLILVQD